MSGAIAAGPTGVDVLTGAFSDDGPLGLVSAVLAAALLWPLGARLGLAPASRAGSIAGYATAAVLVELYAPTGVDGSATLLLAAAGCLAVGRRGRNLLAGLLAVGAAAAAPVTLVGFLALLAGMAAFGAVATRFPVRTRRLLAAAFGAAAVALAAALVRAQLPPALPPVVLGVLSLWTLLVVALLWRRLRWLRPLGVALLAVLVCCWLPGPDADAVVVLAAAGGLVTAVLAAERPGLVLRPALTTAAVALALVGALLVPGDTRVAGPLTDPGPTDPGRAGPVAAHGPLPDPDPAAVRPVGISIPVLDVSGPLETLTADPATGELAAPADPSRAGWYAAGVVPGDAGPAVVGGHVDSRAGPGVFFGLRRLRPGDRIEITRSDGRAVRFAVTTVTAYPKAEFPTAAVYGPVPAPELRLVTCGGTFDRAERSYRDNIVVDAVLT